MKQKFHYFIILIPLIFVNIVFAQGYTDYLIDENNTKIFCKIVQIKNGKVRYKLRGKSYSTIKTITKFSDAFFTNPKIIKNPLGLKIEKPKSGFAHVYFYYSGIVYKIKYNGEKLVNIKAGSYFLHKIKVGETHNYSCFGNNLEIVAENQNTYIIRANESGSINENAILIESNRTTKIGRGMQIVPKLVLDNRKVSEYALLSMSKKVE